MVELNRFDVYLVYLDPTQGPEINKTDLLGFQYYLIEKKV